MLAEVATIVIGLSSIYQRHLSRKDLLASRAENAKLLNAVLSRTASEFAFVERSQAVTEQAKVSKRTRVKTARAGGAEPDGDQADFDNRPIGL
jgi:hypothetical protein